MSYAFQNGTEIEACIRRLRMLAVRES